MRAGASPHDPNERPIQGGWVPTDAVIPGSVTSPDLKDDVADDRRRILWRDSATILIGLILAILAFQTFAPGGVGTAAASGSPIPSGVSIGTLPPPISLPPGITFGPIVDPSLGVDATPTPIPVITLGPSPSPSPSPSPEPTPTPTRKPPPKPSTAPATSTAPSTAPSPSPTEPAASPTEVPLAILPPLP